MSEFFDMGGYAAFVWPCYILAGVIMLGLLVHSIMAWREQETLLNNLKALADKKSAKKPVEERAS